MIKGVWKYRLAALVLGGAMLCSLSACVPVMMVGGTVSGSMAATDRRTLGAQTEDKVINLKDENRHPILSGTRDTSA